MTSPRVAIVWHGDRAARDSENLAGHRLGPTAACLHSEGLAPEPCVYNDDFAEEALQQIEACDAALVWVNPIEDGRDRVRLDAVLQQAADHGTLVSAHPRTVERMGTKEALYHTRHMGWGSDVRLYRTRDELRTGLSKTLAEGKPRVLKQYRGHSGRGVWKVTPIPGDPARIQLHHAQRGCVEETLQLDEFLEVCESYFVGIGRVIDQEYIERIAEGTVRCYLVKDRVEGFGHQQVNALVEGEPTPGQRLYSPPDDPRWQPLRARLEHEWLGQMTGLLGVAIDELPLLWDADFMFGPTDGRFVLCEINVSSVYPYPDSAMRPLAHALATLLSPSAR